MIDYSVVAANDLSVDIKKATADFLYKSLDEFGDSHEAISACLDYVTTPNRGGLVLLAKDEGSIVGAVVLNKTGMSQFIPENILVYIAVNKDYRGKKIGKTLMEMAIKETTGDIALHVEPHNPAAGLYKSLGFTNKYLEMRYQK